MKDGLHPVPEGKIAAVVTYLEMTAPPAPRAAPLPAGVVLRDIRPDVGTFRALFRHVGAPWLWTARLRLDDAALGAIIDDPRVHHATLTRDGIDEALLELDFREKGACELSYFGLGPALIGTGAGRALMEEAIRRAWAEPISRFHVHTCTLDSPQAVAFYLRSGFRATHREVEIFDDPRHAGLLPTDAAPQVPLVP